MGEPREPDKRRAWPRVVVIVAVWGLALATTLGLFGRLVWLAELFCHFSEYYLVALLPGVALSVWMRMRVTTAAALVALCANAWLLLPHWLASPTAQDAAGRADTVHLLNLNVYRDNREPAKVAQYLQDSGADVIVVQEITSDWVSRLSTTMVDYEPALMSPSDRGHYGIGLLVRREADIRVEMAELFYPDPSMLHPAIQARLRVGGRLLHLLAVHVHPPFSWWTAEQRLVQLGEMSSWIAARDGARVMLGDMNVTPFSPHYADLLETSGLKDTREGEGLPWTWYPVRALPFGLPIDGCLYSPELVPRSLEVGPYLGSDHRPLHATLQFKGPRSARLSRAARSRGGDQHEADDAVAQ